MLLYFTEYELASTPLLMNIWVSPFCKQKSYQPHCVCVLIHMCNHLGAELLHCRIIFNFNKYWQIILSSSLNNSHSHLQYINSYYSILGNILYYGTSYSLGNFMDIKWFYFAFTLSLTRLNIFSCIYWSAKVSFPVKNLFVSFAHFSIWDLLFFLNALLGVLDLVWTTIFCFYGCKHLSSMVLSFPFLSDIYDVGIFKEKHQKKKKKLLQLSHKTEKP